MIKNFLKKYLNKEQRKFLRKIIYYFRYGYRIFFPKRVEKTVVVLTMHRSGSSLVSGILNILGVDMGRFLLEADRANQKGYFENKVIEELNNEILKEANGSWDNPPSEENLLNVGWFTKRKISHIFKIERSRVWGFKDPRTALTINLFLPHLINPYFVVCRRSQEDIAKSLKKRNNFSLEQGTALAETYQSRIDKFLKQTHRPVFTIDFNDIFAKPQEVIEQLGKFLDVDINPETKKEILNFIDPQLVTSSKINE